MSFSWYLHRGPHAKVSGWLALESERVGPALWRIAYDSSIIRIVAKADGRFPHGLGNDVRKPLDKPKVQV